MCGAPNVLILNPSHVNIYWQPLKHDVECGRGVRDLETKGFRENMEETDFQCRANGSYRAGADFMQDALHFLAGLKT